MKQLLFDWFKKHFSDPQAITLLFILSAGFLLLYSTGDVLAPLFTALVIAYLLDWIVEACQRWRMPRLVAVIVVFTCFLGLVLFIVFGLLPLMWNQLGALINEELPNIVAKSQQMLLLLPQKYPQYISENTINELFSEMRGQLKDFGQQLLSDSINSLGNAIAFAVYAFLVPLLVFLMLKDREILVRWCLSWLPKDRHLANKVWVEMNEQIGNYVRGKVVEIVIVGAASYIAFALMSMNYALILAVLVGLSVLIPYIGATVVTIPVALIGFFQWGWSDQFGYAMLAYGIIQLLDGNVLVPILFSEAVNLHPVAIIVAVLFFGGMWGFWGVFFAIPLATLVKAVFNVWPSRKLPAPQ